MPKDEGQGLMVSVFVSRDYGFNWTLTEHQLNKVNKFRKDKDYMDVESAKAKMETQKRTIKIITFQM